MFLQNGCFKKTEETKTVARGWPTQVLWWKQNAMLHNQGRSQQYCWIPTSNFQTVMTKNGHKIHWNHFNFSFGMEIIHRLCCTWQQMPSEEELETEGSVWDNWGHQKDDWWPELQGNEGAHEPCLALYPPPIPVPQYTTEFATSNIGGKSSSQGHPQTNGSPEWFGERW